MNTVKKGYIYEIDQYEGKNKYKIAFIEKDPPTTDISDVGFTDLKTVTNGTTTEEVLKVLIEKYKFNLQFFPKENSARILIKLQEALMWEQNF